MAYHNLTEEVPRKIWMLVPVNKQTVDPKYRLLQTRKNLVLCSLKVQNFRVANIERAVVEALYYASKIGLDVALTSASIAIGTSQTTVSRLMTTGKKLGYETTMKKYWQSLQAIQKAV